MYSRWTKGSNREERKGRKEEQRTDGAKGGREGREREREPPPFGDAVGSMWREVPITESENPIKYS